MKSDKIDKRAAALRDNLKRRKMKAKTEKENTKNKQSERDPNKKDDGK